MQFNSGTRFLLDKFVTYDIICIMCYKEVCHEEYRQHPDRAPGGIGVCRTGRSGVPVQRKPPTGPGGGFAERLEESFVTVAFAEAADYDQIHDALGSEQRPSIERPDDCAFGDNDLCFIEV